MTKDEALDLAMEALEHMLEDAKQERLTVEYWNECVDAITAIKQARALDKKAENARELGLDYEPVQELQRYSPSGEGGMEVDSLGAYVKHQDVTTPPAAQRQWIGLTDEEHTQIAVDVGCMSSDWLFYGAAVERALKNKNT
jgi:type V secretory pathway adhesin AidA